MKRSLYEEIILLSKKLDNVYRTNLLGGSSDSYLSFITFINESNPRYVDVIIEFIEILHTQEFLGKLTSDQFKELILMDDNGIRAIYMNSDDLQRVLTYFPYKIYDLQPHTVKLMYFILTHDIEYRRTIDNGEWKPGKSIFYLEELIDGQSNKEQLRDYLFNELIEKEEYIKQYKQVKLIEKLKK